VTRPEPGEITRVGDEVRAVRPITTAASGSARAPRTRVYFVRAGRSSVYFASDTEFFAEMAGSAPSLMALCCPFRGWVSTLGDGPQNPEQARHARLC